MDPTTYFLIGLYIIASGWYVWSTGQTIDRLRQQNKDLLESLEALESLGDG